MSHKPNGARTLVCKWCGKHYQFTNWMRRWNARAMDGTLLRDTHQLACYNRLRRLDQRVEKLG